VPGAPIYWGGHHTSPDMSLFSSSPTLFYLLKIIILQKPPTHSSLCLDLFTKHLLIFIH
jgi:hypothetical protein